MRTTAVAVAVAAAKKQCLAENSRAKKKKGLAWVKAHCCVDLEGLGKCNKRGHQKGFPEALPCKCKSQRQCFKGPVDAMAEGGGARSNTPSHGQNGPARRGCADVRGTNE